MTVVRYGATSYVPKTAGDMPSAFYGAFFGLALCCALALGGVVALWMRFQRAERRIAALEAQMRATAAAQRAEAAPAVPQATGIADAPPAAPAPEPRPKPQREPAPPPPPPPPFLPQQIKKAPKPGLEEALGANWTVWVGGVALALGGLLLVRYSIEQGYFGPAARCVLGLAFGIALALAGEFVRRREKAGDAATQTPAILTAAGTVAAFGAIYAAHGLYGFIGPTLAFVALGAVALAAILGAVLHGPSLAGLGLAGAGVAPLLVTSAEPSPWPILLYLAVVAAAADTLARWRGWIWLGCATAVVGALWALLFASSGSSPDFAHAALLETLISTAFAAILFAFLPHRATADEDAAIDPVATIVVGGFAGVASLVVAIIADGHSFDLAAPTLVGVLVVGLAYAGARLSPAAALTPLAGALVFAVAYLWPDDGDKPARFATFALFYGPLEPARSMAFAALGAAVVALLSAARLAVGSRLQPALAGLYAAAGAVTPLIVLALAYLRLAHAERSVGFAILAALIAGGYLALADFFRKTNAVRASQPTRLALGAFATATFAALALGLVFALDKGMLTIALAFSAWGAAYVCMRLDIGGLRLAVAAMGFVVLGRLIWDPRIVGADLGAVPIFNWLLIGYGAPAIAFAAAARLLRRAGGEDLPVRLAQSLSLLFAALLVFFEIRHALNGGDPYARSSSLIELGLMATSALLFSLALTRLEIFRAGVVFSAASMIFGVVSALVSLFGLVAYANPYLDCGPIEGGAFLNGLLLGYLAPAIAAAMLMRAARGVRSAWFSSGAGALSLVLLFLYACLQTRRLFHDAVICDARGASDAEIYAYSAVWLGFGVALLLYGILRRTPGARLASAVFTLAAALKVFLYDLSGLEGLLRALSFIGLGLVLIGIGLVYQKLLYRSGAPSS